MFNIFKRKNETKKTNMSLIKVKKNNNTFNCFKGKFVSIEVDIKTNNYYIMVYDNENNKYIKISNKIDNQYSHLCESYDYGLIYDFDNEFYTIAVICQNGYLKTYDVKLNDNLENGTAFIVKDNDLIDNGKIVGTIKRNNNDLILLNSLDHNKLICFMKK